MKKWQGDESSVSKTHKIDKDNFMFKTGDEMCPYESFAFYMEKLNEKNDFLWQKATLYCHKPESDHWYDNTKVGQHTICKWMPEMSISCSLSQKYTNYCIRKTCTMAMAKCGFQPHEIAFVTKH